MANVEKKKAKLVERIVSLETELRLSLQKKSSPAAEINMPGKLAAIARLKVQLAEL
jgi:hypothetical protein